MTPWLIVAGDFTPLGGMDRANHALARYLARRGPVHLVTHRAWPDLEAMPAIVVHRARRPFDRHALGSAFLSRDGRRAWEQLRAGGVQGVVNGGNCALPAANWVHYLHAAWTPCAAGSRAARVKTSLVHARDAAAERTALAQARVVICNSERTRRDVVERLGVPPSRVHVLYYGSDPDAFAFASDDERRLAKQMMGASLDRPLVGFVGALGDRRKGFDTVFDAWSHLCADSRWDADLAVVGTGADRVRWEQRAHDAGLAGRIRFLGFRRDVPQILAATDLLLHPARYEAYGLSVHEAICRGVPAIVSASAGVAERLTPTLEGLLLADPDDASELASRMLEWRRRAEHVRHLVRPVSDALRARTWDAMAAELAGVVEAAA